MTSAAIMQPTYLPWIGYFGLMDSVDTFVLLDTVQFDKRSWQQRNRIKTASGPAWLTVPVSSKGKGDQLINEAVIDRERNFADKHIAAIRQNYSKAPCFDAHAESLFAVLGAGHERLVDLTVALIEWFRDAVGIATPIRFAHDMNSGGAKDQLLADLCGELGAEEYVSPPAAQNYLDGSAAFEEAGIAYRYFDYEHPVYKQRHDDFVPYMSAIDLLFNEGDESLSIIRKGVS